MPPVPEQQFEEFNSKLDKLVEQNNSIMSLLKGNPLNKNDQGILGKMEVMEQRITKLERIKDRTLWILYGAGAVTGWSLTGLLGRLQELITKH